MHRPTSLDAVTTSSNASSQRIYTSTLSPRVPVRVLARSLYSCWILRSSFCIPSHASSVPMRLDRNDAFSRSSLLSLNFNSVLLPTDPLTTSVSSPNSALRLSPSTEFIRAWKSASTAAYFSCAASSAALSPSDSRAASPPSEALRIAMRR